MTTQSTTNRRQSVDPLLLLYDVQDNPPDVERAIADWSRTIEARNTLKSILDNGGTTREALEHLKDRYHLVTDAAVYNLWKRYVRQAKRELGMPA